MTAAIAKTFADLNKAEAKAWSVMMNGSEMDARTVHGEEGKNYVAWCEAADRVRAHLEAQERMAA